MTARVVVVGAGYAGVGTINALQAEIEDEAEITWISEHDYHLVLHEVHRVIRDPSIASKITLPISDIKAPETEFVQSRVTEVDVDDRLVHMDGGDQIAYDYLLMAIGSRTAFYGIDGLREHAYELKGLEDARSIHGAVTEAAKEATLSSSAQVVVGGAGLSGIQAAGEIAEFRDEQRAPIDVTLVEGLDEVFPGNDPDLQSRLRSRLEGRDIGIETGEFISKVDDETVYLGGGNDEETETLQYDVLLWTGGITGPAELGDMNVDRDERSDRVVAESDFTTSDERVFALGDTALINQGDTIVPPTAQAAWRAADVAGENLARAIRDEPLDTWAHSDQGTAISVGENAVVHDVPGIPIKTFGGLPARLIKKAIAARWIATASSVGRGISAFSDM